jgi:DNA-binding CsgD family transcriptional regulator
MDILDLSTVSADDANRATFLDQLCDRLGLDFASYASLDPFSGQVVGYANYPDEWKRHYAKQRFHQLDPTLLRAALSIAPVDWSRFATDAGFNNIFDDALAFGISSQGLSIPVRGPFGDCGILNVTRACDTSEWRRQKGAIIGDLQTAAVHFHDIVMSSGTGVYSVLRMSLSSREREILQWVAAGKSQQDVGDILSIAIRTVEVHLRSAREKLGALTTAQAVGRAIRLGLIQPA